jgi:hypothetical protein
MHFKVCEQEYMNMGPPIIELATPLINHQMEMIFLQDLSGSITIQPYGGMQSS